MKIVFIPTLPLTFRDYEMLGIKYFHDRNYSVSVLETHQLLLPNYKKNVDIDYYNYENIYQPLSEIEFLSFGKTLSKEDYIIYYLGSPDAVMLLNKMKNITSAKFVTYISGSIPTTTSPCGYFARMKSFIRPIIKKMIVKKFNTDIVVLGSPKDELIYPFLIGKDSKKVYAHSRDYELCINADEYKNSENYAVFLDTDIVDASDYVISKKNYDKNKDIYYDKLITFFEFLESKMNMEVIISAHPKSRIFKDKENFRGHKIVHNNSESLVKNSKFILSEGTTAISFAVYFSKPMMFFTMKEIDFFANVTCSYAKQFSKTIYNVDDVSTIDIEILEKELKDLTGYEEFKYNYLTYKDKNENIYSVIERVLIGR